MIRRLLILVLIICAAGAAAYWWWYRPSASSPESTVRARIEEYDRYVLAMDAESIARMFTENGEMWSNGALIKRGPDAIQTYLQSLNGKFRVESQATTVDRVVVANERVTVFGTYHQTARMLSDGSVTTVTGDVQSIWVPCEESSWCIKRIETTPK
jgi:ketosteroid isomerase-like protein